MKFKNTIAKISLENLKHNYRLVKESAGGKNVLCVVKANAYGHGSWQCAKTLKEEGVNFFAVANIDEGITLRENNIDDKLLILGYVAYERLEDLLEYNIISAVYSLEYAKKLNEVAKALGKRAKVHIKLNSGMNRLGFKCEGAEEKIKEISNLSNIDMEGIFSHFAASDSDDLTQANSQMDNFNKVVATCKENGINFDYVHIQNSAGTITLQSEFVNMVRAGIVLYGVSPSNDTKKYFTKLKPVMTLVSHIANIFNVEAGAKISYSATYEAKEPRKLATICCGYADGYFRTLSNAGYILINGQRASVVGIVCMDMFMVDITDLKDVHVSDEVELFGENLPIFELAQIAKTIGYEFLCSISQRVERVYIAK